MQYSEEFKTPKGFIDVYGHKGSPEFVKIGLGEKQGYFVIPKDSIVQEMHVKNLVVAKASKFMAKRMVPGVSWGAGIGYLELGTGVGTGTTQAPQAEASTQEALRTSLIRNPISAWTYLDGDGAPTATETNVVQYSTTFTELEAIGALVEMGLFGGDATATAGTGYMFNYKVFAVWNKDDTMQLTIRWEITY